MINTGIKSARMNLSLLDLTGKVASVTGAGRGVRRAMVGFAQAGAEALVYTTGEIIVVSVD